MIARRIRQAAASPRPTAQGLCGATIEFGDSFGDSETTFCCRLISEHEGVHMDHAFLPDGIEFRLTWTEAKL